MLSSAPPGTGGARSCRSERNEQQEQRDQQREDAERRALEEKLAGKLAEAEKQIAATRTAAMGNVKSIAADAAGAIVQRLTGTTPDAGTLAKAVDASLKG